MTFFSKEVKIGITGIVAIVVLFCGLQFLKGLSVFSNDNEYNALFDDVSGLSASSPVYANGYKVGVVKAIDYSYTPGSRINVVLGLDKQMRVPRGTHAELSSDLLGNIKINLVLGANPTDLIAVGDTISGGAEEGAMGKVAQMVPAIEQMLPKLDSIMSSLNMLLADPALQRTLHNVEGMTANLDATSRELQSLSARLNSDVPAVMQKADGVLANTQTLTANLAAVDVAALSSQVSQTLQNVEQMTARLNSSEGTLGLLMRDPALYNNLTSTAASADSLLRDLKSNPKRYVHFSVFGKKQ